MYFTAFGYKLIYSEFHFHVQQQYGITSDICSTVAKKAHSFLIRYQLLQLRTKRRPHIRNAYQFFLF